MTAPNTIASDTLVEAIAVAIVNSDRIAGGWPPVESRDDIPDSDGYVRNATAALTAITEAGFVVCPRELTEAMLEVGLFEAESCTDDWTSAAACLPKHVWGGMIRAAQGGGE